MRLYYTSHPDVAIRFVSLCGYAVQHVMYIEHKEKEAIMNQVDEGKSLLNSINVFCDISMKQFRCFVAKRVRQVGNSQVIEQTIRLKFRMIQIFFFVKHSWVSVQTLDSEIFNSKTEWSSEEMQKLQSHVRKCSKVLSIVSKSWLSSNIIEHLWDLTLVDLAPKFHLFFYLTNHSNASTKV